MHTTVRPGSSQRGRGPAEAGASAPARGAHPPGADAETAWDRAAVHARRAGERRDELDAFTWGLIGSWLGPTPVEAGLARTDRLLEQARGDRKGMSGVL